MKAQYTIESDRFFGMISSSPEEAIDNMLQHPEDFGPDETVTLNKSTDYNQSTVIYSGLVKDLKAGSL